MLLLVLVPLLSGFIFIYHPAARVRVPSLPSTLFSFKVFVLYLSCKKNEKSKRGRVWPIFKKIRGIEQSEGLKLTEDDTANQKCCQNEKLPKWVLINLKLLSANVEKLNVVYHVVMACRHHLWRIFTHEQQQ